MASRKVSDLIPAMQEKVAVFAVLMAEAGIPWMITCTYRSQEEQDELYSRGRTIPNRRKVTWTQHSKHTDRLAFDFAVMRDGKPTWDLKANVNINDEGDYIEAGIIGESVGLKWGGRFSSPDYCHFEWKEAP